MKEKLVRDRIPRIIAQSGRVPRYRVADSDEEYEDFLALKLVEETQEFAASRDIEEIVDVLEVLDALLELKGVTSDQLAILKRRKAVKRGKYVERLILSI